MDFLHPIGTKRPGPYAPIAEQWEYAQARRRALERVCKLLVVIVLPLVLAATLQHTW